MFSVGDVSVNSDVCGGFVNLEVYHHICFGGANKGRMCVYVFLEVISVTADMHA